MSVNPCIVPSVVFLEKSLYANSKSPYALSASFIHLIASFAPSDKNPSTTPNKIFPAISASSNASSFEINCPKNSCIKYRAIITFRRCYNYNYSQNNGF